MFASFVANSWPVASNYTKRTTKIPMAEWVIDSTTGTVPILLHPPPRPSLPSPLSLSFLSSFFRRCPRVVPRGSWMPDDYIDRVGGWSEASKVAAKSAIYPLRWAHRPTTRTRPGRENIYYLLWDRVPLIPFHRGAR